MIGKFKNYYCIFSIQPSPQRVYIKKQPQRTEGIHDALPAYPLVSISLQKDQQLSPEESHHVLAPQRDGGSRVFAKGKYGRRSRGV